MTALVIADLCIMRPVSWSSVVHQLYSSRLTGVDALFGMAFVLAWQFCFSALPLYDRGAAISERVSAMLKGVFVLSLGLVCYLAIAHRRYLPVRIIAAITLSIVMYQTFRLLLGAFLVNWLAARDPRRVVILGSGRRASKAWREIRTTFRSSVKLLGFVDDRGPDEMAPDVASRYLGPVQDLSELLLNRVVDTIVIAMPIQSCYSLIQRAIPIAESAGVHVVYLEDIYSSSVRDKRAQRTAFRELAPQHEQYYFSLAAKRALDIIGALLGMVACLPLMVAIAIGVKLTSKGPVLFKQERYGCRRRRFTMIKFRSMVQDAEQMLPSLEHANEASGPIFKIRNDPRVTRIGRILRKTSMDELPQLWNVLIGDMSLVGPRPMSIRDVALFSEAALMRRFSVKPGMTGLWQVSGRSEVGFDEWIAMDNRYIDRWSLFLDARILARTVNVVFRRSGAM